MTAHNHREYVPGCYRCELGRDEVMSAVADERDELQAEVERLRATLRRERSAPLSAVGIGEDDDDLYRELPDPASGEPQQPVGGLVGHGTCDECGTCHACRENPPDCPALSEEGRSA